MVAMLTNIKKVSVYPLISVPAMAEITIPEIKKGRRQMAVPQ
jgi:hypothetical protein